MKDLIAELDAWHAAGRGAVVARLVDVVGSGPRAPGAAMAVDDRGEVIGSVSGGCVEGAVVTEAEAVRTAGSGRLVRFGYSDDEAFAVGLTCGGTVELFLEPLAWDDPALGAWRAAVRAHRPVALVTVVGGDSVGAKLLAAPDAAPLGTLGDPDLDRVVARDALGELAAGTTAVRHYGAHGEARADDVAVFVESFAPAPRLVVFGAVDFTAALVRAAKLLGFHVTVCDARAVFATAKRFPEADEVVVAWPGPLLDELAPRLTPRDAVCVLTHDHRFDVPAVLGALATDVGYLGAMGSRRTHAERVERLRAAGVTDEQLARLHAPIGLDLGATTPEETAVAICAEIIAARSGRSGLPLAATDGPIH